MVAKCLRLTEPADGGTDARAQGREQRPCSRGCNGGSPAASWRGTAPAAQRLDELEQRLIRDRSSRTALSGAGLLAAAGARSCASTRPRCASRPHAAAWRLRARVSRQQLRQQHRTTCARSAWRSRRERSTPSARSRRCSAATRSSLTAKGTVVTDAQDVRAGQMHRRAAHAGHGPRASRAQHQSGAGPAPDPDQTRSESTTQ